MDLLIFLLIMIVPLWAQHYINVWYRRTKKMESNANIKGCDVARKILDKNGLSDVKVVETSGVLSDHYDPKAKVVRLSSDIYNKTSLAAVSVAAHECGHAIQDKDNYFFLRLRSSLVPIVNLSSIGGYFAVIIGLAMAAMKFIWLGIILELVILLFQLITLPVEFNASKRGLQQITDLGMVGSDEHKYCFKMLRAAALTYVASVVTALLDILRLLLIVRRDNN